MVRHTLKILQDIQCVSEHCERLCIQGLSVLRHMKINSSFLHVLLTAIVTITVFNLFVVTVGRKISLCLQNCKILFYFSLHLNTAWKVSKYRVFSGPYFPAFGLNTERYSVFGHISHSVGYTDIALSIFVALQITLIKYVTKLPYFNNLKCCHTVVL